MEFCKKKIIPDFIYILIFIKIKIFKLGKFLREIMYENFCVGLYFYMREIFRRLKIKIKIIFFLFLLDSRRHKTKFKVLNFSVRTQLLWPPNFASWLRAKIVSEEIVQGVWSRFARSWSNYIIKDYFNKLYILYIYTTQRKLQTSK